MSDSGNRLLPILLAALLLAVLAGALATLSGPGAYLPRVLLLASTVAMGAFVYRGRREIGFLFVQARTITEAGPGMTWLLLALALLAASAVFAERPVRWDATDRGLNRLGEASRAVLDSRTDPVELIGVFRETAGNRDRARDLLEIYRNASRRVGSRMLDPDRVPEEARALGVTRVGVILVRSGEVREEVDELSEAALTQAILRVENPGRSRILFTVGHGERAIGEGGLLGIGRFASALRQSGYQPGELRLYEEEPPDDAAMLAIVGPQRALLPSEVEKIGGYLDRGGRLFLCLEPGVETGLEGFLRYRGVQLDSMQVHDESAATRGLGLGPRTIVITEYGVHPIVAERIGYAVLSGARSVRLSRDPIWGIDAKELMRSGPDARLIVPHQVGSGVPATAPASIPVAVVEEWEVPGAGRAAPGESVPEKPYARLLVVGDADWISGQFLDLFANRDLALRSVHWLCRREFLLKIPPLDVQGTPLRISLTGIRGLFLYLLVLPILLLATGLWIWNRRR